MEKAKILIVEDEPIIAMETKSALDGLGYCVTSIADTGDKAIEIVQTEKPDIVLMDIRIKGKMDGIEVAKIIRTQFEIPVVFMTAYLDKKQFEEAKMTMPFGYILKPVQERELKITIEMAIHVSKVEAERRESEQGFKESEEKYRSILESIEDAYYETDLKGKLTFFNDALCDMYGYTRGELLEMSYWEYTPKEQMDEVLKVFNRVYETENPQPPLERQFVKKDGGIIYTESTISLKKDKNGHPIGFFGIIRDTTERFKTQKALRESEEKYRSILESIEEGYVENDLEGNIVFFNESYRKILGYERDELLGKNFKRITEFKNIERKIFQSYDRIFKTGKSDSLSRTGEAMVWCQIQLGFSL